MSNSGGLDIQMQGIVDNIVFSKRNIWVYYSVDTEGYDFLNQPSKISMLRAINQTFTNIAANKSENVDMHILITNTPVDINHWESQYLQATEGWDKKPGFSKFFESQLQYLRAREYLSRKIYLGIKIGDRHLLGLDSKTFMKEMEAGFKQAASYVGDAFKHLNIGDYDIKDSEIRNAKSAEQEYYALLSTSALNCERPEAEELALVMKRSMYPAMPAPYLDIPARGRWGKGDIVRETGAEIVRNRRWLEISQPIDGQILTGYRATITFSKFPEMMSSPSGSPWIYIMQRIGIPFDMSARFTLIPSKAMKKKIAQQRLDIEDEAKNAGQVGVAAPRDLQEDYQTASDLESFANRNDEPFIQGSFRMIVTSFSKEELLSIIDIVKTTYSNSGIILTWTSGDQVDLFLECMPGDDVREKSFIQMANIELVGASGFNIANKVGDDDKYNGSREI